MRRFCYTKKPLKKLIAIPNLGNVNLFKLRYLFFILKTCQVDVNFFPMILSYTLKFSDFSSESNFLKLQNKFATYDDRNSGLNEDAYPSVIKADFSIVYKSIYEFNIETYSEISFQNEFLIPKINNLSTSTILKIKEKIKEGFLYNESERSNFIKITLDEVIKIHCLIIEASYLEPIIIDALRNELESIIDFLSNFDFNLNFGIKEKIQFNLNKADLMLLMYLLRKNGIINVDYTDADFGKLIERFFQYQPTSSKNYVDIIRARKELNDLKNMNDTFEKSVARLKKQLQDNSFYQ